MFADVHVVMEDADRQALGAIWRERLENARARHEGAKAALQAARERQSQISSLDGNFALDHALRAEQHAFAEFKRVLTIFGTAREFVRSGILRGLGGFAKDDEFGIGDSHSLCFQ